MNFCFVCSAAKPIHTNKHETVIRNRMASIAEHCKKVETCIFANADWNVHGIGEYVLTKIKYVSMTENELIWFLSNRRIWFSFYVILNATYFGLAGCCMVFVLRDCRGNTFKGLSSHLSTGTAIEYIGAGSLLNIMFNVFFVLFMVYHFK